ncbi:adenine phosphoribosyltransferase [Gilvimarinus japonicus]|uniref:Adenine phosphoribosyltransferase n=1 Tax=Gilvimarinus japonicus TaxID=1796469 RepID=A0ABV7HSF7_9GAMM
MNIDQLKATITTIPDYPKPGINFRDVTSLLQVPEALRETIRLMCEPYRDSGIDKIVAIEARGFVFGAAMALELGCGLVLARKPGKLPRATRAAAYTLEYGENTLHIHTDAIHAGERVLLVDDLIATGGTAEATVELIKGVEAILVGAAFAVALVDLPGLAKLSALSVKAHHVIEFEGD